MRILFIFSFLVLSNLNLSTYNGMAGTYPVKGTVPDNPSKKTQRLFVIERNMNKNTVCYDAVILPGGKIDISNPIDAYWIDYATTGKRSELNYLQRHMAYGYSSEPSAAGCVYVTLKAFAKRKILLLPDSKGNVKSLIKINNNEAQLTKIFVSAKPKSYTKVDFIELYGNDARSGKPVYEKILNQ